MRTARARLRDQANHSLRHGHTEASCYGYGLYALLRAAVYGDVDGGHELSWLAIRLHEKLGGVKLEGCMLHLPGEHVNFWKIRSLRISVVTASWPEPPSCC